MWNWYQIFYWDSCSIRLRKINNVYSLKSSSVEKESGKLNCRLPQIWKGKSIAKNLKYFHWNWESRICLSLLSRECMDWYLIIYLRGNIIPRIGNGETLNLGSMCASILQSELFSVLYTDKSLKVYMCFPNL